jgi:hypothetical protein
VPDTVGRSPPLSLSSLSTAANASRDKALILFVNSYIQFVDQARYARREPTEGDAEAVMKVVDVVRRTTHLRRMKERREDSQPNIEGGG